MTAPTFNELRGTRPDAHTLRMQRLLPGPVSIDLEQVDEGVMLTLTHRQLTGAHLDLNVCAGWHAHLQLLVAHLEGTKPPSLWSTWKSLRKDYEEHLCAN